MNFKRLIKTNVLERTVVIMNFIGVSLSSWYSPFCEEIVYYEENIMRGDFQLHFKQQPPCLPQLPPGNSDFVMGHQRWQDDLANWGTSRCAQTVLASDVCCEVNLCLSLWRWAEEVKNVRTTGKAVKKKALQSGTSILYLLPLSEMHTEI